jgi:hypothetical protein
VSVTGPKEITPSSALIVPKFVLAFLILTTKVSSLVVSIVPWLSRLPSASEPDPFSVASASVIVSEFAA